MDLIKSKSHLVVLAGWYAIHILLRSMIKVSGDMLRVKGSRGFFVTNMMEVSVVKPTLALDFNNLICAEAKMEDGGWTTETRQLELE